MTGGGGVVLLKNLLDRVEKVEGKVDKAVKEMELAIDDMKLELVV